MYDLIIIGAGPAGISAAIYAARKMINFLVISKDIGGQTLWTADIENYISYKFISGANLVKRFKDHLEHFKVNLKTETVTFIEKENDIVKVKTDETVYEAKTLIIASGRSHRKLGVKGEEEFANKGVAYCATCDAPLFADKNVVVVGGGNSALEAVLQLIKIGKKVYIINNEEKLRADPIMIEKAIKSDKLIIYNNTTIEEIYGDNFVEGVKLIQDAQPKDLRVQGVFIEIGSIPSSELAKDIEKNDRAEIHVNCRCETNIPGIFAAGDVTDIPAKQIIVACGEGTKALLSAFQYISRKN